MKALVTWVTGNSAFFSLGRFFGRHILCHIFRIQFMYIYFFSHSKSDRTKKCTQNVVIKWQGFGSMSICLIWNREKGKEYMSLYCKLFYFVFFIVSCNKKFIIFDNNRKIQSLKWKICVSVFWNFTSQSIQFFLIELLWHILIDLWKTGTKVVAYADDVVLWIAAKFL